MVIGFEDEKKCENACIIKTSIVENASRLPVLAFENTHIWKC